MENQAHPSEMISIPTQEVGSFTESQDNLFGTPLEIITIPIQEEGNFTESQDNLFGTPLRGRPRKRRKRNTDTVTPTRSNICLECQESGYLKTHLEKQQRLAKTGCLEAYRRFYNLHSEATIEDVLKAKDRVARSRRFQAKRIEDPEIYREFNKSVLYPQNVTRCSNCKKCDNIKNMAKMDKTDQANQDCYEMFTYLCKQCQNNEVQMSSRPQMSFKTTDVHNFKIAYPERDDETGQDSRLPDYVMLPTNESAKSPDSDAPIRADSDFIDSLNRAPDNLKTESIAENLFFAQLKKINDTGSFTSLKRGKIVDPGEKKIRINFKNPILNHVRSTTAFFQHYCDEVSNIQMFEGPIHLIAELELDPLSIYTLILALKQENLVEVEIVTRNGEDNFEQVQILVHPEHDSSHSCPGPGECVPVDIIEFFRQERDGHSYKDKNAHTAAMSLSNLFTALTRLTEKSFNSSNFSSMLSFQPKPVMKVALWPKELDLVNEAIAKNVEIDEKISDKLATFLDSHLTTSTSSDDLCQNFGFSQTNADIISSLAKDVQQCEDFEFPSVKTIRKQKVKEGGDLEQYLDLQGKFQKFLEDHPSDNLSVEGFLELLEVTPGFNLEVTEGNYNVTLPGCSQVFIEPDSVLNSLLRSLSPLSAIYHRVISVSESDSLEFVLKRMRLADTKTSAYKPLILLASESAMRFTLVSNNQSNFASLISYPQRHPLPDILQKFEADHDLFPLLEALYISNPRTHLTLRGIRPCFISTSLNKLRSFKPADEEFEEDKYTDVRTGKDFNILDDAHSKYLKRIGNESLSFAQFCADFKVESKGEKESSPQSQVETRYLITSSGKNTRPLPKEIMTVSGHVIKLRRSRTTLNIVKPDRDSNEYVFSQVLLYSPHVSLEQISNEEDWNRIISEKESIPMKDARGVHLTKVETVKRLLYPKYCDSYYDSIR